MGAIMRKSDQYHKWVEWSEEDRAYLGHCPDIITSIHGEDPVAVYADLCKVVEEVIEHFEKQGRPIPQATIRPTRPAIAV